MQHFHDVFLYIYVSSNVNEGIYVSSNVNEGIRAVLFFKHAQEAQKRTKANKNKKGSFKCA